MDLQKEVVEIIPHLIDKQIGRRLTHFIENWKRIGCTEEVLDWLKYGVKLVVEEKKIVQVKQREISQMKWVEEKLNEYLSEGIVEQIKEPQEKIIISPIHTVKKQGKEKYRLVHDLRTVNGALVDQEISFKMEHFLKIEKVFTKGMWGAKLDIKAAYSHVPIHMDSTKYLGFQFKEKMYKFVTLPFGLSIAPRIFTKILNQMLKHWRGKNILVVGYIDDILILGREKEETKLAVEKVKKDLVQLGWKVKEEKCIVEPTQNLTFLGIQINLKEGHYEIPQEKIQVIQNKIISLLKMHPRKVPLKIIASVKGKVIAASIIEKQLKRIVYSLDKLITITLEKKERKWNSKVRLNQESINALNQVLNVIEKKPTREFYLTREVVHLVTDASLTGYGGYIVEGYMVTGKWKEEEQKEHINLLELRTVEIVIKKLSNQIKGKNLHISIDNTVAASYLKKGYGKVENLNKTANNIWDWCQKYNVTIEEVIYIPSEENLIADPLSRGKISQLQDWGLNNQAFKKLEKEMGPFTIDLYASKTNKKLRNYRGYLKNRDALSLSIKDWEKEEVYCCPPISMITKTIMHMIKYRLKATIVIPQWEGNFFYPLMLRIKTQEIKLDKM
jgi:hypothetical protein